MMCGRYDYLTLDVEKELADLILTEIKMHRDSEELKQELASYKDYKAVASYEAIDDINSKFIH